MHIEYILQTTTTDCSLLVLYNFHIASFYCGYSSPFFSPGDSFFHISISSAHSAVFVHSERTVMRLEFPDKVGQTNAFTHIGCIVYIHLLVLEIGLELRPR